MGRPEQHIKVNINKEYVEKIKQLKKEGLTNGAIAKMLNIRKKLVEEAIKDEKNK